MASFVEQTPKKSLNIRAIGFCGADDSVDPLLLQLISTKYPWVEWGVLLRPDLEGTPRYPTAMWLDALVDVNKSTGSLMRLAGHLCKQRCQEVRTSLSCLASFILNLVGIGWRLCVCEAHGIAGICTLPSECYTG